MNLGKKTPTERCGIKIEDQNKWLKIILNANREKRFLKQVNLETHFLLLHIYLFYALTYFDLLFIYMNFL